MKVLGIQFCMALQWASQVNDVLHLIRGYVKRMRHLKTAAVTKCKVICAAVLTASAYAPILSDWKFDQLRKVSNQVSHLISSSLGLPATYPYDFIHSGIGGLGFQRFETYVLLNRERSQVRCIAGPLPAAWAARGLFNKGFRCDREDNALGPGDACSSSTLFPRDTYTGSLVREGLEHGLALHRRGRGTPLVHIGAR